MTAQGGTAQISELLARVERLEADRAIADLLSRYSLFADAGRVDEWLNLFTEDAHMDLLLVEGDAESGPLAPRRLVGHEQLRRSLIDSPFVRAMRFRVQHHMAGCPTVVTVSDDVAVADAYSVVHTVGSEGQPAAAILSVNHWTFRRVDGTWKIAGCVRRRTGTDEADGMLASACQ